MRLPSIFIGLDRGGRRVTIAWRGVPQLEPASPMACFAELGTISVMAPASGVLAECPLRLIADRP